ncbi:MAG: hypothetical protein JKY44_11560 [Flavobacteriaceae bacterium]|nr:hypothetical protein [Flavobacteriaceae bacterium]
MSFRQKIFSIVGFLFISIVSLNAQEDKIGKKKTVKINAKTSPIKPLNSLQINATNGFKNAYKNTQSKYKKIAEEKALINKGVITPEMLKNQRLKKNLERHNFRIPMVDRDLGVFRTKSPNINILSSDFGFIDGDVISIHKNGVLIVDNYILTAKIKIFKIPLTEGFNKIEITAMDEGEFRPNTGHFVIYDDLKQTFISDLWYLAKGAKVYAMIIKEK